MSAVILDSTDGTPKTRVFIVEDEALIVDQLGSASLIDPKNVDALMQAKMRYVLNAT